MAEPRQPAPPPALARLATHHPRGFLVPWEFLVPVLKPVRGSSLARSELALNSSLAPRRASSPGALTPGGHVVPKHRRSVVEPSAEYWPEAVGYGQAAVAVGPAGYDYPAGNGYDGADAESDWAIPADQSWQEWQAWGPPPALHPDHPSAPVPRVELPADHPSGPMPTARTSGPPDLPRRRPGGSARSWNVRAQAPEADYDNGNRRLHVVRGGAAAEDRAGIAPWNPESPGRQFPAQPEVDVAGPAWPEPTGFQRRQGPPVREVSHIQRQRGASWQESSGYQRQTGGGLGAGPASGRSQEVRSPNTDLLWSAEQVLKLADGRAAQIAQEAQDYAAALRDAAEREAAAITQQATSHADAISQQATSRADAITREAADHADAITQEATARAAAIREAAEQEAAALRSRLQSMSGDLSRVVAAYVTESLAVPAMPTTAPAMPVTFPPMPETAPARPRTAPDLPGTGPDLPGATPARPGARPAGPPASPRTRSAPPDTRPARPPAGPGTTPGPAKPKTAPTRKPQTQGRQRHAMRIATAATATLLSIALIGGAAEIGMHGFNFFTFRAGGTGETAGTETDRQFLAQEAAAAHHAPTAKAAAAAKGRHHKKTLEVHHT